jgi:hypothetical protein
MDRRYLTMIAINFGGGPVGIETIAASLSEPRDAIEEIIEPFLLQQGFIQRTPRGRVLTATAWKHLGMHPADHVAPPRHDPAAATKRICRDGLRSLPVLSQAGL